MTHRNRSTSILLGTALLISYGGASQAAPEADTVYLNANVVTMDDSRPTAEAIAIKGQEILAVGSNARIQQFVGASTKSVDLKGKTVLPGFIDSTICRLFVG